MDQKLIAWARAVKARQGRPALPPLWLFTDGTRLPDPLAAVARLPAGLCGVVLRDDDRPDRAALAARLARLCRQRRLLLVLAGDPRLARRLGLGQHWRAGRPGGMAGGRRPTTASAHNAAELHRALAAGARLVFLSPVLATASHPGAPSLGPARLGLLIRGANSGYAGTARLAGLGGITGHSVRRLPPRITAAGAIGALA
jgi:thiamine-phosphate pyrophosphorylase